jgi:monovalent cation:proton antiporter-2 (CPA2) family protein
MNPFTTIAILLGLTVLFVPLFKRAGLGSVLGYLAAGVVIGPSGLRVVDDPESLLHTAEIGVVLLLFVIGLELQPSRLWALRRQVFGLGFLQLAGVGAVIGGIALAAGLSGKAAVVLGWTLALSSTALVLPTLAERKELTSRYGRESFAVLLFQDLSVIVLLAILPLLGVAGARAGVRPYVGLAVLFVVVLFGRKVLDWMFNYVARFGNREVFTAAALLVALGLALLMEAAGLSRSLGAFVAGVLLADSEFRHELEASIAPFETLLLGLFFIAVGMAIDLSLVFAEPVRVFSYAIGLLVIKAASLYLLRRFLPHGKETARPLALSLAQGGEFAFVIFALLDNSRLVRDRTIDELALAVALSMVLAPLFFIANDELTRRTKARQPKKPYDTLPEEADAPVVIAGFGRVGQLIGRLLLAQDIRFTALDIDPSQVELVRRYGTHVYYGDASHLDLLRAAGVAKAKVFVLAIDDVEASLKTAELVRRHFAHVRIVARARNRFHAYRLMDLGVEEPMRETLLSTIELGRRTLIGIGRRAEDIERVVTRFAEHDAALLRRQHAVYHNDQQLMQTTQEARAELVSILEQDREAAGTVRREAKAQEA